MAVIEKRKNKKGDTTYRVKIRLKGLPPKTATFKRLTDARRWEQQTETALRQGKNFRSFDENKHSLSEAIDKYIQVILPTKPKSYKKLHTQLKWWDKEIGKYALIDLTPNLLSEYRNKISEGKTPSGKKRSPATANRYLAALSHLFTIAVNEWGWIENNPLKKVTRLKESRGIVRFLSDEERKRLLLACKNSNNKELYTIVALALSTGARKMEVLNLRWENIDFHRSCITLHETKNGERRSLPLTPQTLAILKKHYHRKYNLNDTLLVFPSKTKVSPVDIRKPWAKG